jgi:hypothetical protein
LQGFFSSIEWSLLTPPHCCVCVSAARRAGDLFGQRNILLKAKAVLTRGLAGVDNVYTQVTNTCCVMIALLHSQHMPVSTQHPTDEWIWTWMYINCVVERVVGFIQDLNMITCCGCL